MGEKFKVTFILDDEDAEYFRALYRKVKKEAKNQDAQQIVQDARGIVQQVRASKKTPPFVLEAIGVMQEARVGCVLVVLSGRLMGIFTERDVLLQVVGRDIDVLKTPVRRLMTADPEYLRPTDSIAYALNAMSLGGYRHVPLVDDARRPVGVVSVRDVINYLVRLFPKSVMNLPTMPRQNYARSREGA